MTVRILALVGDCYGARGGISRYNQDLFEALAANGAEVLVIPRHGNAADVVLPPGVRQWPPSFNRPRYSLISLWAAWRHRPIDVVFCGHVFMAPLAWALARLFAARYWLQTHGIDIWTPMSGLKRVAIESADLVTAVSRVTRRRLLDWTDLAPDRVRVLPNTVRGIFSPGAPSPGYRARLGIADGPLILTVGRLASTERSKGHEAIFSLMPALRQQFPGLVYLVAGEGDDLPRLKQRAEALGLGDDVVRFLGFVPDTDLPDLYRLADLFVMPSATEGFGIVYLEAAACGLRVLGGAGDGSMDAIQDSRIGSTVDPDDSEALRAAIAAGLRAGRVDPAAIDVYRRPQFAHVASLLLAELMQRPHERSSA